MRTGFSNIYVQKYLNEYTSLFSSSQDNEAG